MPGDFYDSSIVLDATEQSVHLPSTPAPNNLNLTMSPPLSSMTSTATLSTADSDAEGGTVRGPSPVMAGTTAVTLTPSHAAGLYASYQRPTRRSRALAERARALVEIDPLRSHDIVDH